MISGKRVRLAREICGYTQEYLAAQVNVHQGTIAYIERGRYQPSDELLDRIALLTKFPPAFFKQGDPPEFPDGSLFFRGKANLHASERDQARGYGQMAFEIAARLARKLRVISPRLRSIGDETADIAVAVHLTRNVFGLSPDTPIANLSQCAEKGGVFLLSVPFAHPDVDAFSTWAEADVRRPVIVAFGGVSGDRLRFSIAHELGHLALHHSVQGGIGAFNREADQFAAQLLMPGEALEEEIETPVTLTSLAPLKVRWGVSLRALVRRAHDLAKVTDRQYRYLIQRLNDEGWRYEEPIVVGKERARALARMAELLFPSPSGGIDYGRLATDLNLSVQRVREVLDLYISKQEPSQERDVATQRRDNIRQLTRRDG
jgi:Zn-dependent peptidase ImmA (M78 family)/transcriptional regulator with XRE-family HTH domain